MSDLFHRDITWGFRSDVFSVMAMCQQHTFLLLTKRVREMFDWFIHPAVKNRRYPVEGSLSAMQAGKTFALPLPNVHLGVSIELPEYGFRTHFLRQTPAAVRYVSFEPLLASFGDHPGVLDGIDQAIVGGESGPGARPMHPDWVRVLRDQCQMTKTQFFFKQHGAWLHESQLVPANEGQDMPFWEKWCYNKAKTYHWPDGSISYRVGKTTAGRLLDGREWNEFPG